MGWYIELLEDTVKVPKAAVKELNAWALDEGLIYAGDTLVHKGKLVFNSDHMEHMDFVWQEKFLTIAKKHKFNGDITFTSADGDNAGSNWGYRFKNGEMKNLIGKVVWMEDGEDSDPK